MRVWVQDTRERDLEHRIYRPQFFRQEFLSHNLVHKTEFVSHNLAHKTEFVDNNLKFVCEMAMEF